MMQDFKPEQEVCPTCGSRGNCTFHASYERYIIDFIHGRPTDDQISVTRVFCHSCHHTHAILMDALIPYDSYSVFFVLWALAFYFSNTSTVWKVCDRFGISPSTLYRWKKAFLIHKQEWLGILNNTDISGMDFIRLLKKLPFFSQFTVSFFRKNGQSFLQTHANPANCRQT